MANPPPRKALSLEAAESPAPAGDAMRKASDQSTSTENAKRDLRISTSDEFLAQAAKEYQEGRIDQALWRRAADQGANDASLVIAAYLRARANLKGLHGANPDQEAGIKIVLRALEEPLRQIVNNAGDEPSVVVNKVVEKSGNFGFNAQTGTYGDLVEMGVVDPTKVTRFALQNAASVASLLLTTEAMVAELPKDEKPMGGGGMGGGMGGMGDMDM